MSRTIQQMETSLRHANESHVAEREGLGNIQQKPYLWPVIYVNYNGMIDAYVMRVNHQLKTSFHRKLASVLDPRNNASSEDMEQAFRKLIR